MLYQPKKSSARWLEGAPKPVLAAYDSGPNRGADRYTVLYGAPLWDKSDGRDVPARAMSANPFHPQGIGLFVQVPSHTRSHYGKKIRYSELPADCRKLVERDCQEDDES